MPSIPVLISDLLRLAVRPILLGPLAVVMVLVREVGKEWRASFLRLFYDLILLVLSLVLVVLLAIELAKAPPV